VTWHNIVTSVFTNGERRKLYIFSETGKFFPTQKLAQRLSDVLNYVENNLTEINKIYFLDFAHVTYILFLYYVLWLKSKNQP